MWAAARFPRAFGLRTIGQIYAVPNVTFAAVRRGGGSKCPNTQTTPVCIFVQERLPEMPACRAYSARLVGLQLESLILAQNERWRHA